MIYWRHELTRSVKNFLFIGVAPLLGAVGLGYLLFETARDLADPKASYIGTEVLGVGVPLAIAVAWTVIGLILMVVWLQQQREAVLPAPRLRVGGPGDRGRDRRAGQGARRGRRVVSSAP